MLNKKYKQHNMKILKFALILFLTGSFINLFAQGPATARAKQTDNSGYKVGDIAEDFNLKNVDGSMVSLSSMDDVKGYIVVFTSNVCPFALMYEDRLIELHNNMAPKGYPVVAINPNDPTVEEGDSFADMQAKSEESKFPFVYLKDQEQKIYPKFGATKTPHVFLLDKEMVVQYIGAIDDNARSADEVEVKYVENAIAALQEGEAPSPSTTKAIGCSIKTANSGGREGGARGKRRGPPSAAQLLERMDADNDLKISKAEAKGPLAGDFDNLDSDADGFLTSKELSAMKPKGRRK